MELKQLTRIVALSFAVASLAPSIAFAHPMLEAASPRVGARVAPAPSEISISFSEEVDASLSKISLTSEDGSEVELAKARSGLTLWVLVAKVLHPLGPGRYRVAWSAVSADGHSTIGDFVFTVVRQ